MATPFIAGFASFIGTYIKSTNPDDIKNAIDKYASKNVITNSKTAKNNMPWDNLNQSALKFLTDLN